MKVTTTLEFPDIQEILEQARDIDDVWNLLIAWFSEDKRNLEKAACASKLIELNSMRNSQRIKELDSDVSEFKEVLRGISKKYGHPITVTRRQKDLIGVIAKMILLIRRGEKAGKSIFASLERLRDFLGIKIVAQTGVHDTIESQNMCYEIINELLKYIVVNKKNTLATLEYEKIKRTFEGILIPRESGVLPVFKDNVKDYIFWIKGRKYQGLHSVATNPNGQMLEIQVRSQEMDVRAEYDKETAHKIHKGFKYDGITIPIDLAKINIDGFTYLDDGRVYDQVGLVKDIDPLNMLM